MAQIGTLKGQRTRAKNSLDKAIAGIQAILNHRANVGGMTHAQLDEIVHMVSPKIAEVKSRLEKLETANEKLSDGYAGDAALLQELQAQLEEESNLMDQVDTAIHEMDDLKYTAERRLEQLVRPGAKVEREAGGFEDQVTQILARLTVQAAAPVAAQPGGSTLKLPKLEIEKFDGRILKWQEFWDSFSAAVHNNTRLQNIEKFTHLRSKLCGDALVCISGLQLSNENYQIAVDLLRKRFGDLQTVIDAHYSGLSHLPRSSFQVHQLRQTYDSMENHIRSLQAIGENIENRQLVSVIKEKMPFEVMHQLNMQKDEDVVWTVENL